ncbi:GNAT family N-acetyltransferase [Streptomyces tsukubensis]|uniref:GNAT family N-acetyltransferase n=1 Tax=Streptomyces tsukubensis TaxID=83656 RepID=A0A1V4A8B0_9ACTN|nr:GNAT family N-acetyltransferase [Streptomyces tsukubensis]
METSRIAAVLDLGNHVYDTTVKPYTGWSLTAIAAHLDSGSPVCLTALAGERLAGFVLGSMSFEQRGDWGHMEWIAVDPIHQGQGVAGRLVEACCEKLAEAGASSVVTDVAAENTASAKLMGRHGFTEGKAVSFYVREVEHPQG